jgi:hypothetical protein
MTNKRSSFVYFIKPVGLDGPIKIGFSNNPEMRLETLTGWSPWPLEIIGRVPGDGTDETFLHECFNAQHSHREWFRSSPSLRLIIDEIVSAGSIAPARAKLTPTRGRAGRSENFRKYQRPPASFIACGQCLKLSHVRRQHGSEIPTAEFPDWICIETGLNLSGIAPSG